MRISELGEDTFLRELKEKFPPETSSVAIGIGDDAAALKIPEGELALLTTDSLVEGAHFTGKTLPPRFVGRKAVAVNASDIAAMGGEPLGVLLSLHVPKDAEVETLWQVVSGAHERARELSMALLGGNLAFSPSGIVVAVTAIGATVGGRALERTGARVGDGIYLTGKIGASTTGLELLEHGVALSPAGGVIVPESLREGPIGLAESCIRAHIDPEPRVNVGRALNEKKLATAAIDVSDGLALDLHRLCRASGVGAVIDEGSLPIAPGALAWERWWKRDATVRALRGGEDYELLVAGKRSKLDRFRDASDVPLTLIGEIGKADAVELRRRNGTIEPLEPAGWDHFR
jgi:thiamine-monophosphate kinase